MRVAVITPFYKTRPEWLAQCHASVRAQTHPCTHVLISDGSGEHGLADFQGQFIRLHQNHADFGDTPRAIGSFSAIGQGFDAIAYLDADNWHTPDHIESLAALHRASGAAVCTSARQLYALDGTVLGACPETDGVHFADTGSLLLTRSAFAVAAYWTLMPPEFHAIDDRWIWAQVRQRRLPTAHTGKPTSAYRTSWPHHYQQFGRDAPAGAKSWDFSRECAGKIKTLAALSESPAAAKARAAADAAGSIVDPVERLRLAHPSLRDALLEDYRELAERASGQRAPLAALPAGLEPARFLEDMRAGGQFTHDWFSSNAAPLHEGLVASGESFGRFVEVGSYEGLSTCWFGRFLAQHAPRPHITAIDTFAGSVEHSADADKHYEARFGANAARFLGHAELRKIKSPSAAALSSLLAAGEQFDLAFVDGSHAALDVAIDAALCWRLLRRKGVLVLDDYFWSHAQVPRRVLEGVNAFLDLVAGEYRVVKAYYQVILQKL